MVDRERLTSDIKNTWVLNRGIPYKFMNYKYFLNDDRFIYALMISIKERHIQVYTYKRFETALEYYLRNIEEEI